jgi:hypothetical protein
VSIRESFKSSTGTAAVLAALIGAAIIASSLRLTGNLDVDGYIFADSRIEMCSQGEACPSIIDDDTCTDVSAANGSICMRYAGSNSGAVFVNTTVATPTGAEWTELGSVSFSGASVYRTTPQSINNATYTAIAYDAEGYDSDSYHSTSSNTSRLTAPSTGYYFVTCSVQYATNGSGNRTVEIAKNGATGASSVVSLTNASISGIVTTDYNVGTTVQLNAGQYVECFARQTSGGALNVSAPSYLSFQITRLGT